MLTKDQFHFAGYKKRNIWEFWAWPSNSFAVCWESWVLFCKGIVHLLLALFLVIPEIKIDWYICQSSLLVYDRKHNVKIVELQVLHKAMKGMGTDDSTLIRVIVSRAEIDMQYIKAEYHKKYKKTLNKAVHSETSGSYRDFLLSLLGPDH